MVNIEWRTVDEFPNYEVSNDGQVRRNNKLLKPTKQRLGYIDYQLYGSSAYDRFAHRHAHRLVAMAFIGPPPTEYHEAAHDNGIRDDNRLVNLSWKTRTENQSDRRRHGTAPMGSNNGNATLCESDIEIIDRLYDQRTTSLRDIGGRFGLTGQAVSQITSRKNWTHVPRYQHYVRRGGRVKHAETHGYDNL